MSEHPLQLRAAYSVCRHIARSAAKNFYYGFLVLPAPKRNALCAVYAFMRRADDISDDPSDSCRAAPRKAGRLDRRPAPRHRRRAHRRSCVHGAGRHAEDLQHSARSAGKAGAGHRDGLARRSPAIAADGRLHYETFDELYDYCYHVASVVGLVCIRIFGYRDPTAEKLAEQTGVAFQLTNIIRDVKEDSQLGRVYLPYEDLRRFHVEAKALTNGDAAATSSARCSSSRHSARANSIAPPTNFLPLIDDDSQPALWTLVQIYHRLLDRIAERNYDVFTEKVRLSTAEKVGILAKGFLRRLT